MSQVAQPGAYGRSGVFRGKAAVGRDPLPAVEDKNYGDEGRGVEQEDDSGARRGEDEARHRGTNRPREIERDAGQGDRLGELLAGDDLRNDRLPHRLVHGDADSEGGNEREKQPGRHPAEERHHAEDARDDGHPRLRKEQVLALVDEVADGAGGKGEEEEGKAGGGPEQGDEERRGGERGHQPGGADLVHPGADVGDGGREEESAEDVQP